MTHLVTMKPAFRSGVAALPDKDARFVIEKLGLLEVDPRSDGHGKIKLVHLPGNLYRLRTGDYRVIYTFDDRFVSLLDVRKRGGQFGQRIGRRVAAHEGVLGLRLRVAMQHGLPHRELVQIGFEQ